MFTLKIHTGPDMTHKMAEKCEEAGIAVPLRGTEHIYPVVGAPARSSAPQRFLQTLRAHHGTDFGFGSAVAPNIRVIPLRTI